jgi:eukaryotic-like serine/threonine-protein kinase
VSTEHSPDDRWIGYVVDSRYRVTEHIGRGGMGSVYKVVHTQIGKVAALKLLHGNLAGDSELIKRFHREAEAISKLNHPNIVQVFDFGRVEETIYLVMEYLKGEDLSAILRRDGPLDFPRAASILIQVCDALSEAHDLGIIHRDLKPENVRISRTRDGYDFVKVMDFGLAKMLVEEDQDPAITARGNLVGTPYYMAPELIRAQPLDHRADIYSLGAMAYRMVTGENAFMANTPVGVLTKHITDDLTPPSVRAPELKIPPAVDAIILRAMAKDRDNRYPNSAALKRELVEVLGFSPAGAQTPTHGLMHSPSSAAMVITPHRRSSDDSERLSFSQRAELGELPTGRIDENEITVDPVLSKEDLAFERKLNSSRLVKPLLLGIPLLIALAVLVYWFALRQGDLIAPNQEIEPNNSANKATPILPDKVVTGHLGQRISGTESDRDFYALKIQGGGPRVIQAKVSEIQNMDLTLELYDSAMGKITGVDSAARGGGETLSNWVVDPGRYYLAVREVWQVDVPPTENVTDAYHLRLKLQPYAKGWEMEPNDKPRQANQVAAGANVRGYLGTVGDRDTFKITSPVGTLSGAISGVAGVDLVLELSQVGSAASRTVDEGKDSSGERFDGVAVEAGQVVLITVRRKETEKADPGFPPKGLDLPYTLRVSTKPGS